MLGHERGKLLNKLKETIENKEFQIAFVVGIFALIGMLQLPYFRTYVRPEAMARLQYEACHINLRSLESAYEMMSIDKDKLEEALPSPPIKDSKKLAQLIELFKAKKLLGSIPIHAHSQFERYQDCSILLPGQNQTSSCRWFCLEHGFAKPKKSRNEVRVSAYEQLKQYGITDKNLLEKCRKETGPQY